MEKVLILTRVLDQRSEALFNAIRTDCGESYSCGFLIDSNHTQTDLISKYRQDSFLFSSSKYNPEGFGTIGQPMVPGHTHFPLLSYCQQNPDYERYWLIEDDVRFTGRWNVVFDFFKSQPHDFVTSHIRSRSEEPNWCWWGSLRTAEIQDDSSMVRSFNVAYRLSRTAVETLSSAHRSGWVGHQEVLIPTLFRKRGLTMLDYTGLGEYGREMGNTKFCTTEENMPDGNLAVFGTVRFVPCHRIMLRRNMLYHPVKAKPNPLYGHLSLVLKRSRLHGLNLLRRGSTGASNP